MIHAIIDSLPNTSVITIRRLKSLGIQTYWDLLNFFPFRYENYSIISKIDRLQEGETVTIIGKIIDSKYQMARSGLRIQKFFLRDESGTMELNWYNQPYLLKLLKKGMIVSVAGEVKRFGKKIVMNPEEYEIVGFDLSIDQNNLKHTQRLVPVYSETRGLSSKTIREKVFYILNYLKRPSSTDTAIHEILPKEIINYNNLIGEEAAYREIHFPSTISKAEQAKKRLAFDELFVMQLTSKLIRKGWEKETVGNRFKLTSKQDMLLQEFIKCLPFKLTQAQIRVVGEIREDLEKTKPMNRFLQGEVGSGKTVVAATACYYAYLNGFQSVIMAPTEILAEQHYQTITKLFRNCQIPKSKIQFPNKSQISNFKTPKICLVTGSIKPRKKELEEADIIIGTHALIQKNRSFRKVGLVVIDEQHRFGVTQRAELRNKGLNPHLLTMTATPIPRTVMLTFYGELDISILDEMPKGRLPIKTYFIPHHKRQQCYDWIKEQIVTKNSQVYIICPLIEESELETLQSIKAAKKEYEHLKNDIFVHYSVGLLHGKLSSKEKNHIMDNFQNKKYDILVATPVVEVGIDVSTATIMIIEGAERFGLAQLHQLRGRVGRGKEQSYCFVFSEIENPAIAERLSYFTKIKDGNTLAQKDLELRGPGNLYGVKQHGYLDLKIASLSDYPMIQKTRKAVNYFMGKYQLKDFPELERRVALSKIGEITKD